MTKDVIAYNWPVVEWYAKIQLGKGLSKPEVMVIMKDYLDTKTFLVREKKEFLRKLEEVL